MSGKKLLFILTVAPFSNRRDQEGLEAIMAAAVFDQDISVLFIGDAIWQLSGDQQGHIIGRKNPGKLLQSFALYDIDKLYAEKQAFDQLQASGLSPVCPINTVDPEGMQALIEKHDMVFSY